MDGELLAAPLFHPLTPYTCMPLRAHKLSLSQGSCSCLVPTLNDAYVRSVARQPSKLVTTGGPRRTSG